MTLFLFGAVTDADRPCAAPLPGFKTVKPMVFAGLFPVDAADYQDLKDALGKLVLNDASVTYEPETSSALGFGFRCGFLGLLHMEIVQERLEREYDLDIIATAPSVEYRLVLTNGEELVIDSPADLPDEERIQTVGEPWMRIQIFTPEPPDGAGGEPGLLRVGGSGAASAIPRSEIHNATVLALRGPTQGLLEEYRAFWERNLESLGDYVKTLQPPPRRGDPAPVRRRSATGCRAAERFFCRSRATSAQSLAVDCGQAGPLHPPHPFPARRCGRPEERDFHALFRPTQDTLRPRHPAYAFTQQLGPRPSTCAAGPRSQDGES